MKKILCLVVTGLFLCVISVFAQEGYLRITSNPESASVEIAGKSTGKTPVLTALKPGKYVYKVSLSGYEPVSGTAEVIENEVTIVNLKLVKQVQKAPAVKKIEPAKGGLTIITDWQDVTIYLNGHKIDRTPPVTIKDIPAGINRVILVSGDYADSFHILVQPGKTSVLKKNFEEDRKKYEAQMTTVDTTIVETPVEVKKSMLPAKVILRLGTTASTDSKKQDTTIIGESDEIEVSFQYRKAGSDEWNTKTLQSGTKAEDSFETEKGTYEIQLVAIHYRVPTGLLNVLLTKKEKIREYKESIRKEILPAVQYTYTITYDGKNFGYKLEEVKLNTPVK
ncbi:MAG TPA: PEGA domain-containing protein [bacterium]|nr:PEGA domain-containing protein [bacterium]HOL35859.1 PEGA domain-containing protein [bacterium]HPP09248.1 PEGA domain-containing protein [bacterium]